MEPHFKQIVDTVEPIEDALYGPIFRCSLTLNDGTYIPCAVLQSKQKLVERAKRRIKEELEGNGVLGGDDPFEQIVSVFVASGNRLSDYDVAKTEPSRFAPPLSLLKQIHGETTMGWTGWVFEMTDGKKFAYGSSFAMEFLQLPEGYSFNEVGAVHNHAYLDTNNDLVKLELGLYLPDEYDTDKVFRERMFFHCAIDGI